MRSVILSQRRERGRGSRCSRIVPMWKLSLLHAVTTASVVQLFILQVADVIVMYSDYKQKCQAHRW